MNWSVIRSVIVGILTAALSTLVVLVPVVIPYVLGAIMLGAGAFVSGFLWYGLIERGPL